MDNIILVPLGDGVACKKLNSVACVRASKSLLNHDISSMRTKSKFLLNDTAFIRGWHFLALASIFFWSNLFTNRPKQDKTHISFGKKVKIKTSTIALTIAGIIAIALCLVGFGLLPLKLSVWLTGLSASIVLKKLLVAFFKVGLLYLTFLCLRLIPFVNRLFKFNGACNIIANSYISVKYEKNMHMATNYLNYAFFSFALSFFMLSLIGLTASVWIKPLINLAFALIIFSVCFEIARIFDHSNSKVLKIFIKITSCMVVVKPNASEIFLAQMALNEVQMMTTCNSRDVFNTENLASNQVGFSYVFTEVKEKLKSAGIYEPSEADWLVAGVLNKNRAEIKLLTFVTKSQYKEIRSVLARRIKGEPLTKIFGYADFYGMRLKIDENVLSPRPETELLAEQVIKLCGQREKVLDLGTGSGAIAIAVAKNTNAVVTALDISEKALSVAKENASSLNVKIKFILGSMFTKLKKEKFDIIVSNPPYIKSDDIVALDTEVKEYDPIIALDGGEDGLDFYREITDKAPNYLNNNGKLLLEFGYGQAEDVKKLLQKSFKNIKILKDYNKIPRIAVAIVVDKGKTNVRKNQKDKRKI